MMIENPSQEEIHDILKSKKRVAVVGLSNNQDRSSYEVAKVLQDVGYEIIPVNPNVTEVLGNRSVAKLKVMSIL